MVEPVAQTPVADKPAEAKPSDEQIERATAIKYQQLQRETDALIQRLMTIEDEKKENE